MNLENRAMRLPLIALTAVAGLLALPALSAWAATPSFPCTKATHEVEGMICKDAELAALDNSLASLYSVVMRHAPADQQRTLKAEQRGWVKGRNDCWKSSDQRGCIKESYDARIRELKDY